MKGVFDARRQRWSQLMGFNGTLDELHPEEVMQLIAMTKKSGKLRLHRDDQQGVVVFREGRVVFAACDGSHSTIGDVLSSGEMGADQSFREQVRDPDRRALTDSGSFVVQVRDEGAPALEKVVRQQIEAVVRDLVRWRHGSFSFEPVTLPTSGDISVDSGWLDEGVDPDALVLNVLTKLDEAERDSWQRDLQVAAGASPAGAEGRRQSEISSAFEVLIDEDTGEITWAPLAAPGPAAARDLENLRRMVHEIKEMRGMSPSLTAEVTLLILRYAAQLVNRGVVVAVRSGSVYGIGQFGLSGPAASGDDRVRGLVIPLDYPSVFRTSLREAATVRGPLGDAIWDRFLVERLGGTEPADAAVVPLVIDGEVLAMFYGDNLPERSLVGTVDGLEILLHELGLAVEKARLERRLSILEGSRRPDHQD